MRSPRAFATSTTCTAPVADQDAGAPDSVAGGGGGLPEHTGLERLIEPRAERADVEDSTTS
jgi:hypothetical protein